MIIPFAIPVDNELLNLSQIVSVKVKRFDTEPKLELVVKMTDGQQFIYTGRAAETVNREIAFAVTAYRAWQTSVAAPPPLIAAPGTVQ